jgi:CheY-like chemotaxis protein
VLVVDDSLSVRKVVERALEARRIEVLSAASGTEAVEKISREKPDLIVCDVIMPDMDGYQICEFVRQHPHLGRTPLLLISGIVNSQVLERAAAVRSDDVLRKPFAADELWNKIEPLLQRPASAAARRGPGVAGRPILESGALGSPSAAPPAASSAPRRGEDLQGPVRTEAFTAAPADLKSLLSTLVALPGVGLAVLVDREGFLIESAGDMLLGADVAGALAAMLAEASEGIGRELARGALGSLILEYEAGVVLLSSVGGVGTLAMVLRDPAGLGKVRYYVKKTLPDMLEILG